MKNFFDGSLSLLSYLDNFGSNFNWRYKKKEQTQTSFGGLLFLGLICYLIYKINNLITKISEGDLAKIKQINKLTNEKISLQFFAINICAQDLDNNRVDLPKYFDVIFENKQKQVNNNITNVKCNSEEYKILNINNTNCLCYRFPNQTYVKPIEENENLKTLYSNEIFSFNIKEKVANIYNEDSIYFTIDMNNNIFNYSNYELSNYYSYFIFDAQRNKYSSDILFFSRIDLEKFYEIDNSEFLFQKQEAHKIITTTDYSDNINDPKSKNIIYEELKFKIDFTQNTVIKITWFTLDDILAILGGLFQIIFLIVGILGKLYDDCYFNSDFIEFLKNKQRDSKISSLKLINLFEIQRRKTLKSDDGILTQIDKNEIKNEFNTLNLEKNFYPKDKTINIKEYSNFNIFQNFNHHNSKKKNYINYRKKFPRNNYILSDYKSDISSSKRNIKNIFNNQSELSLHFNNGGKEENLKSSIVLKNNSNDVGQKDKLSYLRQKTLDSLSKI